MTLRKFKNIFGKQINVLGKPMKTKEVLEFDIPEAKPKDYRITRDRQEIENLVREKYIKEIIEGGK